MKIVFYDIDENQIFEVSYGLNQMWICVDGDKFENAQYFFPDQRLIFLGVL